MSELEQASPLFKQITEVVTHARRKAYQNSNAILLQMYWQIGHLIVEDEQQGNVKATYGKATLKNLAQQLTVEFGKGFDESNLRNIRQFYLAFPIRDAVRHELSWTHYRIISRLETEDIRNQYLTLAVEGGWNTRTLQRNITSQYLGKYQVIDISKFNDQELADAFVFPTSGTKTASDKQDEDEFWAQRRNQFENRSPKQKIYAKLLQLKFQLEDYIGGNKYKEVLNFGYFLNEYVSRQEKKDKDFAVEVDVKPAVLSQYINNHRKPKDEFVIRLELHSNGMIPAISWFKLIQKDKEHEIMTNQALRREESKHVKNRLDFAY